MVLAGTYNVDTSTSKMEFKFTSSGQTGAYDQIVQYKETESPGLYNLAFGNLQPDGEIDDSVRTNNGDRDKILSTVALTAITFTTQYPTARIFIIGSCKIRTRLYRIGISNNYTMISKNFIVFGLYNDGITRNWEYFRKDIDYEAFVIERKIIQN